jgi:hypothetical protein
VHINIDLFYSLELRYILSIADPSEFSAAPHRVVAILAYAGWTY